MTLKRTIENNVIEAIEDLDMVFLEEFAKQNHGIISALHKEGVLTNEDLLLSIERSVMDAGERSYKHLLGNQLREAYPDHLPKPELFAYFLSKKMNEIDLRIITFDHGENPESFIKIYGKADLLVRIKETLLNGPKNNHTPKLNDDGCCESSCKTCHY